MHQEQKEEVTEKPAITHVLFNNFLENHDHALRACASSLTTPVHLVICRIIVASATPLQGLSFAQHEHAETMVMFAINASPTSTKEDSIAQAQNNTKLHPVVEA